MPTNSNLDTPPGVGGKIDTSTGAVLSGPNAGQQAGMNTTVSGNQTYTPAPISATTLSSPAPTPLKTPTPTTPAIPSLDSLLTQPNSNAVNSDQNTINTLTNNLTSLIVKSGTQSERASELNAAPGGVNDLNAQINELNKQITDLHASTSIAKIQAEGERSPSFLISGHQTQIDHEATIKMLGLSAAATALQGDLSLAQQKVATALKAEFDPIAANIEAYKTLLTTARDQMSADQKKQADALSAQLADRSNQIQIQQNNKKDVYAVMLEAAKAGAPNTVINAILGAPNGEAALNALSAAGGSLINPLDTALKQAQLRQAQLNAGIDPSTGRPATGTGTFSGVVPTNLQPYFKTSSNNIPYVDLSSLSPAQKQSYAQIANANGIKPVFDAQTAEKINAIAVSKENLGNIQDAFSQIPQTKPFSFAQGVSNSIAGFFGDQNIKAFNSWRTAVINNVQALAGGQGSGLRINQAEIDAAMKNDLPVVTGLYADTPASAAQKIKNLTTQLNAWENRILGTNTSQSGQTGTLPNGTVVTRNADGSITDAQGNKYDENGNKI